nr:oxytocin receptor-like [Crassostrea gigas]
MAPVLRLLSISLYVTSTLVVFLLNLPVIIILISGRCMGRKIRNVHILSLSITDCMVSVSSVFLFYALRVTDGINDPKPPLQYARCWVALGVYLLTIVASLLHLCFICADPRNGQKDVFTVSKPRVIFVRPRSVVQEGNHAPSKPDKPTRVKLNRLSLRTVKLVAHRKAVVTLLILAGCLLFCLSPLCAVNFLMGWSHTFPKNARSQDAIYFVCVLSSLNSACNPLVYAFRVNEVRHNLRALKKKLTCCFCSYLWHVD